MDSLLRSYLYVLGMYTRQYSSLHKIICPDRPQTWNKMFENLQLNNQENDYDILGLECEKKPLHFHVLYFKTSSSPNRKSYLFPKLTTSLLKS